MENFQIVFFSSVTREIEIYEYFPNIPGFRTFPQSDMLVFINNIVAVPFTSIFLCVTDPKSLRWQFFSCNGPQNKLKHCTPKLNCRTWPWWFIFHIRLWNALLSPKQNKCWHFGPRSTHKAIPVTVNWLNFGKTIFSKYKGVIYDFKI